MSTEWYGVEQGAVLSRRGTPLSISSNGMQQVLLRQDPAISHHSLHCALLGSGCCCGVLPLQHHVLQQRLHVQDISKSVKTISSAAPCLEEDLDGSALISAPAGLASTRHAAGVPKGLAGQRGKQASCMDLVDPCSVK